MHDGGKSLLAIFGVGHYIAAQDLTSYSQQWHKCRSNVNYKNCTVRLVELAYLSLSDSCLALQ